MGKISRKLMLLLGVAGTSSALILGGVSAANAALPVRVTKNYVLNKSKQSNYTSAAAIGACVITTTGGTCGISRGKAASRTIDLTYGLTRSFVAGQIGVSASSSVQTTVDCRSPALKKGQRWAAHSIGNRWTYQLRTITTVNGRVSDNRTSGLLHAFDPYAAHISCGLG